MLDFAFHHPHTKVVYLAPTIKQARDICWRQICQEARPVLVGAPNETRLELTIRTRSGTSEIWLRGTENVESLRGQRIDFLVVDEVASIRDWRIVWGEVLRPTLTDTKGPVIFIGTPKGYDHFHDLYRMEDMDTDYKSFHFTTYDNPFIPADEIDKAKREIDTDTFNQEYMAKFVKFAGAVYKEWDIEKQYKEIEYGPHLPVHLSFDFGVNDPTAIIWIQPNGKEYRIIDYYESSDANIDHFVQVIRSKPYRTPALCTGDPAGNARAIVTGTSPIEEYSKHQINIRTKAGVTIPEQIRLTHRYMPSLFVSRRLERFRDCLINYRYPDKSTGLVNQSNEIPIHDEYSHAMRALEYYFTNVDSGVGTQTYEQLLAKFPRQELFDKYGISNL